MSDGAIAIVGASCRFPGAADLDGFWRLLTTAGNAVGEVDAERWSTRFYFHPNRSEPGKSYTWSAGLIDGVDRFEPAFFGISPREAAQMDPQQRLLLELVWHAVEDAGIPLSRLSGGNIGVYVGASSTDYSDLRLGDPAGGDSYFMTGNTLSILANRISYIFDLRGPSLTVDTACSSSLVALHHACEAIRGGRIAGAIVGGVNLLLAPYPFVGFCRASMLSKSGRCFAFDERADGYVRAEGGGVVILKPLAQALAAGDAVRAVIRATGVNSDGRTIGLSLPSETAQAELLRAVYGEAGIAADQLAFFEMHGTGTPAGDPIEAAAVGHALGQKRGEPLPIGSVKTNIGHLEPASGMAGLLKAALALDHGTAPPTLYGDRPNPNIAFADLNLRLLRAAEPLIPGGRGSCVGVNSFGFGGTNAHAVLAAPPRRAAAQDAAALPPLLLSAKTEGSLRELVRGWRDALAATSDAKAPALLRAAARGRDLQPHRLVALGRDRDAAATLLGEFLEGRPAAGLVAGTAVREGKLAFVFAGNGAQFPGMARDAFANPAFRAAVAEVDALVRPALGWSVADLLANGADAEAMARADVAQPLLFAAQVGIVAALREQGVAAAAHVGHSVGEIAAAWAAGALSLADAGRVVVARSRQQERTRGTGRMAALALGAEAARDFLAEMGSQAEVAARNAGHSVTISGSGDEIARLELEARRRGLFFRPLDLDFAFHSNLMEPIREDLLASLAGLSSRTPQIRLVSTVTGNAVADEMLDSGYWWRNIRHPVLFADAVARLIDEGCRIFLEIGPSPVLQSYLKDALRAQQLEGGVLGSLARKQAGGDPFPAIAARVHIAGGDVTQSAAFDGPAEPRGLPLYPWQRERFWFEKTVEAVDPTNPPFDHPLLGFRQPGPLPSWLNHLDAEVLPWIADHAIEGMPVLPAAAVLETALAAARWRWPEASTIEAVDVEIRRPLPFDKARMRELRVAVDAEAGEWQLASRLRLSAEPMTVHAVGRISTATETRRILRPLGETAGGRRIDAGTLYRLAGEAGLDYGPRFRTVTQVEIAGPDCAVAALDPAPLADDPDDYLLHPALLDGAFQALLGLLYDHRRRLQGASFLPWRFGRVRLAAPFGRRPRRAELRLTRVGVRSASADIALFDEAGEVVAELADCWFRRVELSRRSAAGELALHVDLVPAPLAEAAAPAVLKDIGAVLPQLAAGEPDAARQEQALLLEALIGSVALPALRRFVAPGTAFTVTGLVDAGAVVPGAAALLETLLRLLERCGAAAEDQAGWRIGEDADLPDPPELWRLLLADAPDLVAELAFVAAAVDALPKTLAAGPRAGDIASSPMLEQLLQASPAAAGGVEALCAALDRIAEVWPAGRPLRILEIGAVGGGATRRLLERLALRGVAASYLATSVDAEQAARLSFLIEPFTGASTRHWSPDQGLDSFEGSRFDVVLAVNACARLRLDQAGFAVLRDLLAPGGLLLAVEPEPNPLWDVVFGQYAGWWVGDASPLRSGADWRSGLAAAGFGDTGVAPAPAAPWPSAVLWGTAPARVDKPATAAALPAAVTVVADPSPFASTLVEHLVAAGSAAVAMDCEALLGSEAGVVTADRMLLFIAGEEDTTEHAGRQIARLAQLATRASEAQARLWIVTSGAQQASPAATPAGAALWGFARVLVNEMPRLTIRLVDVAAGLGAAERAAQIAAELAADSPETEIAWTPEGRHVLRLRRGLPPRRSAPSDLLVLSSRNSGGLDGLGWEVRAPRPLAPRQVEIEVHAAGLNFRDVMWGMGLLPEEALMDGFAGPTFGLECAGIVRAVGAGVEGLAVGDRVMALAPASLASRVVTIADAVVAIPPQIGFAAAATIPVTFLTAIYALGRLAQLMPGEHVLIHAAGGGVGLAAIQYAKHRGAIVIATARSEVKRAFLRLAGADHVVDSRDLGFADAVREITRGQGVDVVLNSLSGEAMEASLGVLKPFGRFLELGKRDFYLNSRIHLRPLRQNVSYFAIDVDQLPVRRSDLARSLLAEVAAALAEGTIRPLAHRTFTFAELDDAFRLMQSSGHIGKIVLVPAATAGVRLSEPPEVALRRDGTYLVSGGLDGFGYAAAQWLAAHGAGAIALVGRRGAATPGCVERVAALAAAGTEVRVYAGDVADRASLAAVLAAIRADQPPLRGVVHAASVIEDGFAAELDPTHVDPILRPKLAGALLLDELTADDPLDLFLMFSSATTLLGAPGQGVYVAANLALEALARRRCALGKPGLAVAWGPIQDAGYLAARPETRDALARRLGAKPIPAAQALAGLPALLASGLPAAGFAETSWSEARRFLPILATPLFAEVRANTSAAPSDESLAERLASLGPDAALALLKIVVAEEAAAILRLPAAGIEPLRPLSELGMDSLMAVELRLALESRLRIDLPLVSLAEGTSVASIAARLAAAVSTTPTEGEVVALASRYEAADAAPLLTEADSVAAE